MNRTRSQAFFYAKRTQALLITAGLLLVLLPFVALSFYNHPTLDDYLDALTVRDLGFWHTQKHFYFTLTGRYTTTVLLALVNPLVYGHAEQSWWPVALLFIFGTLGVLYVGIRGALQVPRRAALLAAGVVLGLWLAYAPGQAEGLYWFTGAYTYLATAWLLVLWLAAFGAYLRAHKSSVVARGRLLAVAALTLAVAGTTEPVALPFLLALLLGAVLSGWWKSEKTLWLLAGIAALGSLISFTAPGNFVRMGFMGNSFGLLKTLGYSVGSTTYLLLTWVGNPVLLAVTALLLPGMQRLARRRDQVLVGLLARIPAGALAGVLALLLAAASSPAYYASGTGLPLRARNTLYLLFVLGWLGVVLTWCCRQARKVAPSAAWSTLVTGRLASVWAVLLVLFFFADYNVQTRAAMLGQGSNNVLRAYRQWLGGDAARYDAEMRARYLALASPAPVLLVPPLRTRPDLLYSFDIAGVASPEMLRDYARYFGKKQVTNTVAAHP